MKIINSSNVLKYLNFSEAIDVMKQCFMDYENKKISQKVRTVEILPDGTNRNVFAIMPAYLGKNRYFGAKVITAFPDNHLFNIPSHLGEILLFNSKNGAPVALIDANTITWIRTAAVSALATDYLAKKEAQTLTLIGSGQQAESHLAAISCVRGINRVLVYDISEDKRNHFIDKVKNIYTQITFVSCKSVKEAVHKSDIICTLTPSKEAFLKKEWISSGTHINAIGTFTPDTREISSELMSTSQIFVDDYSAALQESGDLLIPITEGQLDESAIVGSLGELVSGKIKHEIEESNITIFDAVGLAVEDLCCAEYVYQKAEGQLT